MDRMKWLMSNLIFPARYKSWKTSTSAKKRISQWERNKKWKKKVEKGKKERRKDREKKDRILQLYPLCMTTVIPYIQEADYNLHAFRLKCHSSPSQREGETERGSGFFGTMVSSGGGRVSVIAQEALVIDCDFLLRLLFFSVSPKVSHGTSYSYSITQMEIVLGSIRRTHFQC